MMIKDWLNNPYQLYASELDELMKGLKQAFGTDGEGHLIESSHKHSIIYPCKFVKTGIMVNGNDGEEYPEIVIADGYYANVHVCDPIPALNQYAIEPNQSVSEYYENQAQSQLSIIEISNVVVDKIEYQVRTADVERINQKIGWMQRNSIESVEWIVADNTTKTCTVDDLYKILDAQQARQDSAIQQYTQWRLGDKQTPFEPEL